MGSKVTCTTCGKVWGTRDEFTADKTKCGKATCPLLSGDFKAEDKEKSSSIMERIIKRKVKVLTQEVSTDTVKSEIDHTKVQALYVEVPKAIYTQLKYK